MRFELLTSSIVAFMLLGVSSAQQPNSNSNPPPPPTQKAPASTADDNPFPEDISRKAADAAKQQQQAPQEPAPAVPTAADPAASNESSSNNGYAPPPDDEEEVPANTQRRKLSIYGTQPRQCETSMGGLVPCGKLGIGASVDGNADDPKSRIAPAADHRALKDEEIADLYFKDGNYAGALGRYEEALSFVPDDEEAAFGIAECASKLGKREEAIEAYKTYLKLAPQGKKANQARRALRNLSATARH